MEDDFSSLFTKCVEFCGAHLIEQYNAAAIMANSEIVEVKVIGMERLKKLHLLYTIVRGSESPLGLRTPQAIDDYKAAILSDPTIKNFVRDAVFRLLTHLSTIGRIGHSLTALECIIEAVGVGMTKSQLDKPSLMFDTKKSLDENPWLLYCILLRFATIPNNIVESDDGTESNN